MIAPTDRGFTLGDGVFETVLADAGRLVSWSRHLDRFGRAARTLGLPPPDPETCEAEALRVLAEAGLKGARAAVRLTWSAGPGGRGLERPEALHPRLTATATPAHRPEGPARLHMASAPRNERSPLSRIKSLAYLENVLARAEARAAGAEEAVMLNTRGEVACAAAANVFWLAGGALHTPELACGALDGLVRADLTEAARALSIPVLETRAGPEALFEAEVVLLTNSLVGVRLAGFGETAPSATAERLARAVDALRAEVQVR